MIKISSRNIILMLFIIFLALFFLVGFSIMKIFSSFIAPGEIVHKGNIALIPIKGIIVSDGSEAFLGRDTVTSSDVVELIEEAKENKDIKAIIFEINSPGGSPVASDEIAAAIKDVKGSGLLTVAWIREIGASGAYWVASSADHIIANKMSYTGAIGVMGSYIGFAGLLGQFNITYERLISGKYKDIGTPYKELTDEERDLLQQELDTIYGYFIEEIAGNRNLQKEKVKELATGMVFLGSNAKEYGLIDEIGGKKEAVKYIENQLNLTAKIVKYEKQVTFFDILGRVMNEKSFYVGKGIGNAFIDSNEPMIKT